MNRRIALMLTGAVAAAALLAFDRAPPALAQTLTAQRQLAFDIYKELVEINTVTATGDTGRAADAMAARLRAAGFSGDDVQVFKPDAQNALGTIYANGQGVPQDDAAAVSWYQKAADQGNTLGQYNLGATETNGTFDIMLDAFAPITVVPLLDELTTPKDWIIGISSGLLSGLLVILLLSFRVPKLRVSRNIVRKQTPNGEDRYQIKVINRRRPWIVNAAAIDISAELHVVDEDNQGAEKVRPINLFRSEPLIIPHTHRFRRWNGRSEHIFSVEHSEQSKLSTTRPIRFRIRARDSFSNYGKVFTQYYRPLGPLRWWEKLLRFWRRESQLTDPIVKGVWKAHGDLRVDPS